MLDPIKIKKDFPIFKNNPDLVYLDSGATSLKPRSVIEKLTEYYTEYSANVFRGIYKISERATAEYEETRKIIAAFLNASRPDEVVFTRNTTESINLISYALGRQIIDKNSEIVVTSMEHHSNFVPWQQLAFENEATFKVIEVSGEGELQNINKLDEIITKNTKIFAITHVSNVLGVIVEVKELIRKIKQINPHVVVVIDGAQAVPHLKVDVQDLGCDFYAFSSHKMFGPTGIGVLWGRYDLLDQMYPFQYGGEMIEQVELAKTTFKKPPHKFEAGTPHIAGVIALKEAVYYLESLGWENLRQHERELTAYAIKTLESEFGADISILGPKNTEQRSGIVAFTLKKIHPHDIAQVLDESNIAIRAGHHCAMPLHESLGINATARATFHAYTSKDDIDKLVEGLQKVAKIFS